ncbi:uncharacterized protein LOC143891863 [Tasmannia lanceolata]|uniref:uncharacterized protein LOC143891863 n=1 Tax=Tasmannia lanceolata TaxID=3420 RepID=UPI004064B2AE
MAMPPPPPPPPPPPFEISTQDFQALRRAVSDVSMEMEKFSKDLKHINKVTGVERAECECCGLCEDCTPAYIGHIKDTYSGKWVCGLCSEAVKEHLNKAPWIAMEKAVESHTVFCKKFNKTTRLNPKLSLARSLRDAMKISFQHRNSKSMSASKIARSSSCVPRIGIQINSPKNQ